MGESCTMCMGIEVIAEGDRCGGGNSGLNELRNIGDDYSSLQPGIFILLAEKKSQRKEKKKSKHVIY